MAGTQWDEGLEGAWFRDAVELCPDAIIVIRADRHVYANRAALALYQADDLAEIAARPALSYLHPEDRAVGRQRTEMMARVGHLPHVLERVVGLRGAVRFVESAGREIEFDGGTANLIILRDVTTLHAKERELAMAVARFETAFEHAAMGMALLDAAGGVVSANPAARELVGMGDRGAPGRWTDFVTAASRPAAEEAVRGLLQATTADARLTLEMCRGDGTTFWGSVHLAALPPSSDQARLVAQFQDVSASLRAVETLAHRAAHDTLTGLPNRATFADALGAALLAEEIGVAVLFCDLDNFKIVNDSLGHEAGDQVLVEVARRLREGLRPEDVVARFGGDEFTVLCPGVHSPADADLIAERLQAALDAPIELSSGTFHARASVGIAIAGEGADADSLMRDADAAMYLAKREGRNRARLASSTTSRSRRNARLQLEDELRRALQDEVFEPWFQPLVLLRDGSVRGVEALARWHRPDGSVVPPATFVPIAEETGLVGELDRLVMRRACEQVGRWRSAGIVSPSFNVTVNASPSQFTRPDFRLEVAEVLARTGLRAGNLTVELTEETVCGDVPRFADELAALRRLGVGIALDDFGVGQSSLSQLAELPIDLLKLDRSFLGRLTEPGNHRGAAVLRGIVDLARRLDVVLLAEGLEEADQLERMVGLGADLGQGWVFCPAMPAADLVPVLRDGYDISALAGRLPVAREVAA